MWMRASRALGVCLIALGACSGDSPTKDLAADVTVVRDGPAVERLVYPDGPGREAQVGDRSPVDGPAADVGVPDKAKPDAGAFCGATTALRCDCYGFSKKKNQYVKLWGKAQQVTSFGDFKVKVDSFGKLKVKQATMTGTKCGEWQTVTSFPDFTYEIVTLGEDFSIKYDSFPGINPTACPNCP